MAPDFEHHESARLPVLDAEGISVRLIVGVNHEAGQMLVFRPGEAVTLKAGVQDARLILLGGESLNGPHYIGWNFVSSSKDKIEEEKQAWRAADWENGRFKLQPTDDGEFIPLS